MSRMIKTTPEKCKNCFYGGGNNGCSYYIITCNRRGCRVGYCDKFMKATLEDKMKLRRGMNGRIL